jgi:hypothetical protein
MIKIWHKVDSNFREGGSFPSDFELIATVETDDLEHAFERTNTIEHYWGENEEVEILVDRGCRSSSVGDVFELNGEAHQVASCGFVKIEKG